MANDCGVLEWSFCFGGCCFFCGTFALIAAIIGAVQYESLKNAEMTECMYFDEIEEDCTVTTQVGKSYSTCSGSQTIYFYKVLSHYDAKETSIECSEKYNQYNERSSNYWQISQEGICICTLDASLGTKQPEMFTDNNDDEWHTCYVADCDDNEWSWDDPQKGKSIYVDAFIVFGVLYFACCATVCLGIWYDNR
eukprot:947182_1